MRASPSMCTLHARGCDGMIAPTRWRHSGTCTECRRHESRMLACHTEPCEVRAPLLASGGAVAATMLDGTVKVVGRGGGGRACRWRRCDVCARIRAARPVAERRKGAVSGPVPHRARARDGINLSSGK